MYFHKNQCKSGLDMLEFKILTNFDLKDRELTAGDDHYSLYLTHNEGILQIYLPHFVRYLFSGRFGSIGYVQGRNLKKDK